MWNRTGADGAPLELADVCNRMPTHQQRQAERAHNLTRLSLSLAPSHIVSIQVRTHHGGSHHGSHHIQNVPPAAPRTGAPIPKHPTGLGSPPERAARLPPPGLSEPSATAALLLTRCSPHAVLASRGARLTRCSQPRAAWSTVAPPSPSCTSRPCPAAGPHSAPPSGLSASSGARSPAPTTARPLRCICWPRAA